MDIKKDPTLIFSIFGAVNAMVFNNAIWIKIAALMTNGLVGLTIAIVILIAIIIYWLCIIRAVVMYIFSLIGISLLILLAPVRLVVAQNLTLQPQHFASLSRIVQVNVNQSL